MNSKIVLTLALTTALFFFTSCDNGSSTKTEKATTEAATSGSIKSDTMVKKMSMEDTMNMDNGLMSSMNKMMDKMSSMQMSGDFDMDFANMMVEHHQGGIDMSEAELKSGKDEKMKAMAQNIISMQKEEQGKLKEIIKNNKPMKMGGEKHDELSKEMDNMKADLSKMKMTGNTDKDFAIMMISHHESAVRMSKDELSHGMNAALKQMAKKGIDDQTREIGGFKSWILANK